MHLENLKDFEWYNEPENVIFADHEMRIVARAQTDFWQSKHHGFFKDDGHFFYTRPESDFECTICVSAETNSAYRQSGLMIRLDAQNWFKISYMTATDKEPMIGHCLTQEGCSDWVGVQIQPKTAEQGKIWYKAVRRGTDFVVFYSEDGVDFKRVRQFSFVLPAVNVSVGAYFCSPSDGAAQSVLLDVNLYA